MGARGPKPWPKNVHALHGNAAKKPLHELLGGLHPEVELPGCPKHLMPEARKEWRRITPELLRYGLVSKLDRAALALYCQEYAWWVWHDTRLQADIQRIASKRAEWEAIASNRNKEWVGGDGFMIPTPNGNLTYSPQWVGRQRAAEKVDKFLESFGLSPSSRSKVTPSSFRQPDLFKPDDEDETPPSGGFGEM